MCEVAELSGSCAYPFCPCKQGEACVNPREFGPEEMDEMDAQIKVSFPSQGLQFVVEATEPLPTTFMLVNKKTGSVWFSPPAINAHDCWRNAIKWNSLSKYNQVVDFTQQSYEHWKHQMKKEGWRARPISILV